jgi:hypothetical protein
MIRRNGVLVRMHQAGTGLFIHLEEVCGECAVRDAQTRLRYY